MGAYLAQCMCGGPSTTCRDSDLSFHHLDCRDQTQVVNNGGKLYPLSHLAGPHREIKKKHMGRAWWHTPLMPALGIKGMRHHCPAWLSFKVHFYTQACLSVWVCVCESPQRHWILLELELHTVGNHPTEVLGPKLRSSVREVF